MTVPKFEEAIQRLRYQAEIGGWYKEDSTVPVCIGDLYSTFGKLKELQAASELSLKAEARIEELEEVLKELYIASGPVANCAYNVGQRHEDWDNIKGYIDKLDSARLAAVNVFKEKK